MKIFLSWSAPTVKETILNAIAAADPVCGWYLENLDFDILAKDGIHLHTASQFLNRKTEEIPCDGSMLKEFLKKNKEGCIAIRVISQDFVIENFNLEYFNSMYEGPSKFNQSFNLFILFFLNYFFFCLFY